ncbi:L,D-transpeptidase Cds6 family protein [Undibacterium sp. TJN19]|uniref:YybH family protein n=1 Tax=Undibacterium sp. TJN19 TaxID=3413055 RepID=UPI003BF3FB0B
MRHILKNVLTLSSLSLLLMSATVMADDAADVGKLLRAGQTNEALQKVDAALAQKPKDAQMRFLKGLILTEQSKSAEAITVFTKLTDDYPELPEPYNNLAVLYASSGQYDKARAALEMAIRTNPTYGTAHENLGDVYAKLASQAYDKALQLDSGNSTAKLKLTLVRNLVGNTTGGTNPKTAALTTPAAVTAPAAKPTVVAAAKPEPEPTKAESKANIKSTPAASPVADREEEEVLKAVESWAKAWSSKDTTTYLAHYAKDFQTPKGETHKAWAEERRNRIEGKGRINVKIEAAKISVDGNTATAKFRQIYTSDQLTANSRKTLNMVKQDGKWQIKQERAGS